MFVRCQWESWLGVLHSMLDILRKNTGLQTICFFFPGYLPLPLSHPSPCFNYMSSLHDTTTFCSVPSDRLKIFLVVDRNYSSWSLWKVPCFCFKLLKPKSKYLTLKQWIQIVLFAEKSSLTTKSYVYYDKNGTCTSGEILFIRTLALFFLCLSTLYWHWLLSYPCHYLF